MKHHVFFQNCLRKPGEFGIGFSETVRITATGAERITTNRLSLKEVFL